MALNLVRNSRVFFTTNLNSDGVVLTTGLTNTNTFEIQVLDGFTFSQNTASETVTLNEAGAAPSRGQRSFNTALEPVDFNFSTYIRPKFNAVGAGASDDQVECEEQYLWNALAGTGAIGQAGAGWVVTPGASPVSTVSWTNSNAHQLQRFGMLIWVDNALFVIDNCAIESASIDFGLDAIATIAWTGRGTRLNLSENTTLTGNTFSGGYAGTTKAKDTTAKYLANKLSVLTMVKGIDGVGTTSHSIPITGGSITFANNLTYLTPANLGVVNVPVTYFTGTRAISGNVSCYLRTGETNSSSDILTDILANSATEVAPAYEVTLIIGGGASAATRVELNLPAAVLSVPAVNAEQIISTTINFTAHAFSGNNYDITGTNEATVKYYAAA